MSNGDSLHVFVWDGFSNSSLRLKIRRQKDGEQGCPVPAGWVS